MDVHRRIPVILIILSLLAFPRPVTAGGWASVRLDVPLGTIETGDPLRIGFTVKSHDVRPIPGMTSELLATRTESGDEVRATSIEEDPKGHYVVEVVFQSPGSWTWQIAPGQHAPTSLPPLTVVEKRSAPVLMESPRAPDTETVHGASIRAGSCHRLDDQAELPLSDIVATSDTPAIPW
jgi:hypothetical protein